MRRDRSKRVTIEVHSGPDGFGRQLFTATWTSKDMRDAHERCEGSCCVDYRTSLQKPSDQRACRPVRAQVFRALVAAHVASWRRAGFAVRVVVDRSAS